MVISSNAKALSRFLPIIAVLIFNAALFATTVTNTDDSGPGSLRQAIADAPSGGMIDFGSLKCPCTIALTSGQLVISKTLKIIGPDRDLLTISGSNTSRILRVISPGNLTLEGVSIANGRATPDGPFGNSGGGLLVLENSRLTLRNVAVRANIAPNSSPGGGIFTLGNISIENTIFEANQSSWAGAAIYAHLNGNVTIVRSTFLSNVGNTLGLQWAIATVADTTFHTNSGGIAVSSLWSTASFDRCTFSGNTAGDIVNWSTDPQEFLPYPSVVTITQSTINSADHAPIGIRTDGWPGNTTNTILRNTIVSGRSFFVGPTLEEVNGGYFSSLGYNLIRDRGTVTAFVQPGDQAGTAVSPIDPRLEPLALNGGLTRTHALRLDSPAVDKGKAFGSTVDQRGLPRPNDSTDLANAPGGDGSDIGAYEVQFPVSGVAKITGRVTFSGGVVRGNAFVTLTDPQQGLRYALINPAGYFRFNDVPIGRSAILTLRTKGWVAPPQSVFVADDTSNLVFTASRSP
jgi:hypothetical protein